MCYLPELYYTISTKSQAPKLKPVVFLSDQEEENEISIGKIHSMVSKSWYLRKFWETKKANAIIFLASAVWGTEVDIGQS